MTTRIARFGAALAAALGLLASPALAQQVYEQRTSTTHTSAYGIAQAPEGMMPRSASRPGASITGPLSVAGMPPRLDEEPALTDTHDVSVTTETRTTVNQE